MGTNSSKAGECTTVSTREHDNGNKKQYSRRMHDCVNTEEALTYDGGCVEAIVTTVTRACEVFETPMYKQMVSNCISQDLSWAQPAKKWEGVLEEMKTGVVSVKKTEVLIPVAAAKPGPKPSSLSGVGPTGSAASPTASPAAPKPAAPYTPRSTIKPAAKTGAAPAAAKPAVAPAAAKPPVAPGAAKPAPMGPPYSGVPGAIAASTPDV
eukprot:gene28800-31990_t